jgi:hypothetical protein
MKRHMKSPFVRAAAWLPAAILAISANPVSAAVDACTQTTPPTGGKTSVYTSDGQDNNSGDNSHTLWHGGSGSMKMTSYGQDAAFKAEWNNAGDFLARQGFQWSETSTFDTYGTVVADYSYTKTGTGGGYSFIGIYGWSNNPLVEYYIVEGGFGGVPNVNSLGSGAKSMGTLDIDGGTYDIYTHTQNNQPSIHGNATFPQFFSIRRTQRTCGRISLSEHWKKWKALNMNLGKMYEAKMVVEAGGGQGSFDLTYAKMQINYTESVLPSEKVTPAILQAGGVSWNTGKSGTVSLLSLNGSVLRTARQDASAPAVLATTNMPKGMYLLRFTGEGTAPETQKLLLDK